MADSVRTLSALQALLAANTGGAIGSQDLRDLAVSSVGRLYGRAIDSNGALDNDDRVILATGGASGITLNPPAAASSQYQEIRVLKVDAGAGTVTLDGIGSDTINGAGTYALSTQWQAVTIWCDGTAWYVIGTGD